MNAAMFQRLESLYDTAGGLDARQRGELLRSLRTEAPEVAARLDAMLSSDSREADGALRRLLDAVRDGSDDKEPVRIGRYRVMWTLGEGGFGIVYLAEQPAPAHRLVAVKVIKPGMDTRAVLARFDDERQALALMDHPSVVTAIDAGATDEGRPFVVMPLVPGLPITAFCAEQSPGIRERVSLMVQVCRGVQHAHARGVIHRDLKPGNIMVSVCDDAVLPRIIDFGLAKALSSPLTPHTTLTLEGHPMGTPEYMSPEQAFGRPADARSDVYSLGAILYELISGRPPITGDVLRAGGPSAVGRVLAETAILAPSDYSATAVPRELDWIVLRCLEKEPDRRYPTAESLAADLERFLVGKRVEAGPPARIYRFRRWLGRHRVGAAAVLCALVAIVGGASLAAAFGLKERAARRHTEQVVGVARGILTGLDPAVAQGQDRTLLIQMLDHQAAVCDALALDDEVAADLNRMFAESYFMIGEHAKALPHAKRASELADRLWGEEDVRSIEVARLLLEVRRDTEGTESYDRFADDARRMLERARRAYPVGSRERILATLTAGRFSVNPTVAENRRMYAELQAEAEIHLGLSDRLTLRVMRARAVDNEPERDMLALLREARRRAEQAYGPDDPDVEAGLAAESRYTDLIEGDEAMLKLLREHLPHAERVLGPLSSAVLAGNYNMGNLLLATGQTAEAEPYIRRAVDLARRKHGEGSVWSSWADSQLLLLCLKTGKQNEAAMVRDRFLTRWRALQAGGPGNTVPVDEGTLFALVAALDSAGDVGRTDEVVLLTRRSKPELADRLGSSRKPR